MGLRADLWDVSGRGDVASLDDPLAGCLARLTAEDHAVATLDLLPDAYVRTDAEGSVAAMNLAARRLWSRDGGSSHDSIVELVVEDDRDRLRNVLRTVDDVVRGVPAIDLAPPAKGTARVRVVRTEDGSVHWLLRRLMIDDDDPTSLLRRKLSDWMPGVSYVAAPDDLWSPVVVGEGLRELLGLAPDAFREDPEMWIRSIHPADRQRVMGARATCVEHDRGYDAQYRMRTHQGVRWVRDLANVVETSSGDRLVVGVVFDVTSEHRAQQVLEELYDAAQDRIGQLRREGGARETLLRVFGHDVRSPLRSALGTVDRLLERDDTGQAGERGRSLETLRAMLKRMQRLVEGVLDEDRLLRGRPLQFGMADIAEVAAEAVEEFTGDRDRVLLEARSVVARVDRTLIVRVIHNLVRNALDYTDEAFPILVRVVPREASVVIAVEDHGPGIPEELRERVLQPFVRGRSDGDGIGLGLTLVQQIVDLHDGTLELVDLDGDGLSVRVELPCTPPEGNQDTQSRPGDPVAAR